MTDRDVPVISILVAIQLHPSPHLICQPPMSRNSGMTYVIATLQPSLLLAEKLCDRPRVSFSCRCFRSRGGGSDPSKTLTQLVHVGGSVEHTSAPQTSHVGAPESHLVGPGLPYLTLCVPMTGSPPRFHVGLSETATVRRTATSVAYRALAPDIQTTTLSVSHSGSI